MPIRELGAHNKLLQNEQLVITSKMFSNQYYSN